MKAKIYRVTPECVAAMMRVGFKRNMKVIQDGVPAGAKVRNTFMDSLSGCINLVLEDESFPDIKAGDPFPLADSPVFETWQ